MNHEPEEYETIGPVHLTTREAVSTITLNRPSRKNALDRPAWDALCALLRRVRADESVRVVVIQGAGGDFCAGADISEEPTGHPLSRIRDINTIAETLYTLPKPVVAKVEGVAVGAGWNLALCCDLVVASSEARFSQIFTSRGLSVDFGGSWLLPRLAGLQQAKRLAFLAEFVSANEAHRLGLVTWVVESYRLQEAIDDVTTRLAGQAPVAVAQTKELLNAGGGTSLGEALDSEARAQAVNHATEDASLARQAFRGKTSARYTGRWSAK